MSELGRFLEVVYGPQDAFRTVQGTLHHWCNKDVADAASAEARAIGRRKLQAPGETPKIHSSHATFFLALPDRLRVEKQAIRDEKAVTSLVVVNRERWWSRDVHGRVETAELKASSRGGEYAPGWNDVERHFCSASLREYFVSLALEPIGSIHTSGRPCVRLRAVRRAKGLLWPHWLPNGADEYEFHADAERGALIYIDRRSLPRRDL